MKKNFSKFTSLTDHKGTLFNQMTIKQMYEFPKKYFFNKKVLDLGCNIGRGLGLIAETAKFVVGVDINKEAINIAKKNYRNNKKIKLMIGDAENLPKSVGKFDTILIFQTIYLLDVHKVILNLKKILNEKGNVIIMSINPDRADFNRAKYYLKYHKINELKNIFKKRGFIIKIYGSIHDDDIIYRGKMNKLIKMIKIISSQLKIIPKNYTLKKILKRIFFGKLKDIPNDVRDISAVKYIEPIELVKKKDYKNYICFYLVANLK